MTITRGRMRRAVAAVATAAAVAAGVVTTVPARASSAAVFDPRGATSKVADGAIARVDERFDIGGGVALHDSVYTRAMPAGWRYPLVVMMGPNFHNVAQFAVQHNSPNFAAYYAETPDCEKGVDATGAEFHCIIGDLTRYGYAVAYVDAPGQGGSTGTWDYWGQGTARAFRQAVRHFKDDVLPDGSRFGKIGAMGGSAEAITAAMGTAFDDGAPIPLDALVLMQPSVDFYETYAERGAVYSSTWQMLPTYGSFPLLPVWDGYTSPAPEPGAQQVHPGTAQGDSEMAAAAADTTGARTPYWQARDFRAGAAKITAPMLVIQGLEDQAVLPTNLAQLDRAPAFKRFILPAMNHAIPWDAVGEPDYPWWESIHAWFDTFLLGFDTGVKGWPNVQIECGTSYPNAPVRDAAQAPPKPDPSRCPARWRSARSVNDLGPVVSRPLATAGTATFGEGQPDLVIPAGTFSFPMHISGPVTLALDLGPTPPPLANLGFYLERVGADGVPHFIATHALCRLDATRTGSLEDRCERDSMGRVLLTTPPIDQYYTDGVLQLRVFADDLYYTDPLNGPMVPSGSGYSATVHLATSTISLGTADESHPLCVPAQAPCAR